MRQALRQAAREELARRAQNAERGVTFRTHPEIYVREQLGFEPWARQVDVLRAIATKGRVACRSGHKVGKSKIAGAAALWFAATHPGARVVVTAPTHRQVRGILWREIRQIYHAARVPLGGYVNESPDAGLRLPNGSEIFGFSTTEPERMAGISGVHVLFIVDEASGVPEAIFEAIEGNRAGGAKLALFSNPTQTSGTFFEAFNSKRDFWHLEHISSRDAPSIPGLATREWAEEKLREWGEESPLYQVRVLGNFPSSAADSVIALADLEAARERYDDTPAEGRLQLGVDVARFGDDDSVIVARRGRKIVAIETVHGMDTVAVANKVLGVIAQLGERRESAVVAVDVVGVGAGVADQLRAKEHGPRVIDANSSAKAWREDDFFNMRSQLAFGVSDWLKDGGAIPRDSALEAELLAMRYGFDARGRRKVRSKDEIREQLGRSPDRADALALAIGFAADAGGARIVTGDGSRWSSDDRGFG